MNIQPKYTTLYLSILLWHWVKIPKRSLKEPQLTYHILAKAHQSTHTTPNAPSKKPCICTVSAHKGPKLVVWKLQYFHISVFLNLHQLFIVSVVCLHCIYFIFISLTCCQNVLILEKYINKVRISSKLKRDTNRIIS